MTDPDTAVGAAPLAHVPIAELPRLIRLKYLTDVNRWTKIAATGVALLARDTAGDPSRSLVWRELLRHYGICDVASVVFVDRFGCWGFLDLWRAQRSGPFTDADADVLEQVAPLITMALRECQLRTFQAPTVPDAGALGPAVALLDDELRIHARTPATEAWLRLLVPPPEGAQPVPAAVYNVAAQLLAAEAGVDGGRSSARVHIGDGFWVTLRAARLDQRDAAATIAVTIEATSPTDRLEVYARAAGLTARERALLDLLAEGTDTREVAAGMAVSENTVQDHLKSIFSKTGTNSRRMLLSRALGSRG